ncbi:hypothetical protein B0T22DRAFT_471700 [Podospora appendiculata]|uniref:Secreted protein n=1 Tax=Podospora appendiculata TaxID=314037 RepID=A0AAE0X1F5_9PEZI|nr:hypothetical protein B0T22DRAFT_471700 [Podospora appendiculata]
MAQAACWRPHLSWPTLSILHACSLLYLSSRSESQSFENLVLVHPVVACRLEGQPAANPFWGSGTSVLVTVHALHVHDDEHASVLSASQRRGRIR